MTTEKHGAEHAKIHFNKPLIFRKASQACYYQHQCDHLILTLVCYSLVLTKYFPYPEVLDLRLLIRDQKNIHNTFASQANNCLKVHNGHIKFSICNVFLDKIYLTTYIADKDVFSFRSSCTQELHKFKSDN